MGGITPKVLPTSGSVQDDALTSPADVSALSPRQIQQQQTAQQRTAVLLRDLWRRKLPMVRDQIQLLRRTAVTLESATLTAPLRVEAAVAAHKLAGSLGMFGYHEGTRFAREMETLLDDEQTPLALPFCRLLEQLEASLPL